MSHKNARKPQNSGSESIIRRKPQYSYCFFGVPGHSQELCFYVSIILHTQWAYISTMITKRASQLSMCMPRDINNILRNCSAYAVAIVSKQSGIVQNVNGGEFRCYQCFCLYQTRCSRRPMPNGSLALNVTKRIHFCSTIWKTHEIWFFMHNKKSRVESPTISVTEMCIKRHVPLVGAFISSCEFK